MRGEEFVEEIVDVAGVQLQLRRGGVGDPLLILHNELGVPGWLNIYDHLAKSFTLYIPSLPGYGQSSRPDWLMGIRDMAAWTTWFVRDYGIRVPLNVVGFSIGGWQGEHE